MLTVGSARKDPPGGSGHRRRDPGWHRLRAGPPRIAYHDDVIDESSTRRGVETVNAKWGNLQAILAGDFLLARASEIVASLGAEIVGLLGRTIGRCVRVRSNSCATRTTRARRIEPTSRRSAGKTGVAVRHGGPHRWHRGGARALVLIDALTEDGNAYGMVFQIVDDMLDVTDVRRAARQAGGPDMVEGVYTLPVLRTLPRATVSPPRSSASPRRAHSTPSSVTRRCRSCAPGRASPRRSRPRKPTSPPRAACAALPAGPVRDAMLAAPRALLDNFIA